MSEAELRNLVLFAAGMLEGAPDLRQHAKRMNWDQRDAFHLDLIPHAVACATAGVVLRMVAACLVGGVEDADTAGADKQPCDDQDDAP